ncbi:hypothetical protein [Thiolapillus sp.]|uniref:hypothetical protein n=2 Tax=Thiolapillus sp. TaxID=2017437 RepID=UPI003AF76C04
MQASSLVGLPGYNCGYSNGRGYVVGVDLLLDGTGRPYLAGWANSSGLPVRGGFQAIYKSSLNYYDLFVLRLDANLSDVQAVTYLGDTGSSWDSDYPSPDLALDPEGNVFITATVGSGSMPLSVDAYNPIFNQDTYLYAATDAYIAKLTPGLDHLLYGTFLGGKGYDTVLGLAVDPNGQMLVTGQTRDTGDPAGNFPTTAGAFDTHVGEGREDVFVSKLDIPENLVVSVKGPTIMIPGERADFILTYKNALKTTARNVVIVADLPKELAFVTTGNGGTFNTTGRCDNQMYWLMGDLAPKAQGTLSFRVEVPAGTPNGDFEVLARIAAENYTSSTFNVSDYLNATPREVRSTIQLSAGGVCQQSCPI